jgi:L-threonylcarbamoyladenylate synthase
VLDVTGEVPRILRAGLVTKEMIIDVVGACEIAEHKEGDKVKSPGVKYRHYRPKCETALFKEEQIDEIKELYQKEKSAGVQQNLRRTCPDDPGEKV